MRDGPRSPIDILSLCHDVLSTDNSDRHKHLKTGRESVGRQQLAAPSAGACGGTRRCRTGTRLQTGAPRAIWGNPQMCRATFAWPKSATPLHPRSLVSCGLWTRFCPTVAATGNDGQSPSIVQPIELAILPVVYTPHPLLGPPRDRVSCDLRMIGPRRDSPRVITRDSHERWRRERVPVPGVTPVWGPEALMAFTHTDPPPADLWRAYPRRGRGRRGRRRRRSRRAGEARHAADH
jgi:hypothetical protein